MSQLNLYIMHKKKLSNYTKSLVNEFNNNQSFIYQKFACEICSSKKFKVFFNTDRYNIKQDTGICLKCGFFFSNPRLSSDSAKLFYNSDYYRKIYTEISDKDQFYNKLLNLVKNYKYIKPKKPNFDFNYDKLSFDFINHHIEDFDTVLDIGCGAGLKLMDFKNLGKKVYGIEPSLTYNKIHKLTGINSKVGFLDDIKEEYDLVLISHVFEHLYNLKEVVTKLEKITKKYLFIEVPGHINKLQSIQNAHNFYFSINTLNYFLLNSKFKLIKLDYCRRNGDILALYEKTSEKGQFSFNFNNEKKKILKIYRKHLIKFFCIRILKFLKIEKVVGKFYQLIKK